LDRLSEVSDVSAKVDNRINSFEQGLREALSLKPEKNYVDDELLRIRTDLNRLSDSYDQKQVDISGASEDFTLEKADIDNQMQGLREMLDSKVDREEIDDEFENVRNQVQPKADASEVDARIKTMSENINKRIEELHQGLLKATTQSVQLASLEMLKRVKELEKKVPAPTIEAPLSRGSSPPRSMKNNNSAGKGGRQLRGVVSLPGLPGCSAPRPQLPPSQPSTVPAEYCPWK